MPDRDLVEISQRMVPHEKSLSSRHKELHILIHQHMQRIQCCWKKSKAFKRGRARTQTQVEGPHGMNISKD